MNKRELGNYYEELAVQYLKEKGYRILNKNFYCRFGEIDIIAEQNKTLVFVEVKYRQSSYFGYPCEAVNYKKRQRIGRTACFYLRQYYRYEVSCRFDIIEVLEGNIHHIESAF
ncbi:YraN family protein [Sporanaerobium hydrogeniformans]|uniref:YraN family protein n=2 Tax=Sporanaerobium hydrogeniformans TaxID=3072179 RepID=A0AC61DE76_9FIRM|nr:YraN family protein [Sporanaerobium hydrogeniformans]